MEKIDFKMVKKMTMKTKKKTVRRSRPAFGAVSTVNTAPVAIGNSVRGAALTSIRSKNGAIVTGRDFMFAPIGTKNISDWCTVGGTPLTPAAFVDSKIRSYLQLYQKYRWKRCVVHYITSSATSSTGDVLFYHAKNRDSVYLNQSSNLLLPFVMTDPDTVLGPQWSNHSTELKVQGTWKSTDYGMTSDLADYADGEVFLLSKTIVEDAPGYILFDYVVEFAEEQVSPRLLTLPIARIQYNTLGIGANSFSTTVGNVFTLPVGGSANQNYSGKDSILPTDTAAGDIFKVIIDTVNGRCDSTPIGVTFNNIIGLRSVTNVDRVIPLSTGFTCYAVFDGNQLVFYPNSTAAYADSDPFIFTTAGVGVICRFQAWISLIGSSNKKSFTPDYG
jgi:hypothetical protein